MTSLSQKSLNNSLTRSNSKEIVSFVVPDFSSAISIEHDLSTDYTCEKMGYYYCYIDKTSANSGPEIKVNGVTVANVVYSTTYGNCWALVLCQVGDIISAGSAYNRKVKYYIPPKGI